MGGNFEAELEGGKTLHNSMSKTQRGQDEWSSERESKMSKKEATKRGKQGPDAGGPFSRLKIWNFILNSIISH